MDITKAAFNKFMVLYAYIHKEIFKINELIYNLESQKTTLQPLVQQLSKQQQQQKPTQTENMLWMWRLWRN